MSRVFAETDGSDSFKSARNLPLNFAERTYTGRKNFFLEIQPVFKSNKTIQAYINSKLSYLKNDNNKKKWNKVKIQTIEL